MIRNDGHRALNPPSPLFQRWGKATAAKLLIFLFFLLYATSAWTQEAAESQGPNTIFFRANNSYREEKYDAAIQDYEQLVNSGFRSANVFYNLGNAYLRTGDKGKAILYYERAFRMRPRDADIRANRRFAQTLVEGNAQQNSEQWYTQAFLFLRGFLSVNEMASIASVLYFFTMVLVILGIRFKLQRKLFYYSGAILCFFLIMVLPSLISGIHESEFQHKAVIKVEQIADRHGPNDDATEYFRLYEGAVIQITRSQADWHQVKRGDGKMGWLKNAVFVVI